MKKIIQLVVTNLPLKLFSLVCGYLAWTLISGSHVTQSTHTIPVCVYNLRADQRMQSPEYITLTLCAPRHLLRTIDHNELAVHIDATRLHVGDNQLIVDHSTLFLPANVNVVHYSPLNASIRITQIT